MRDEHERFLNYLMETLEEIVSFWRFSPVAADYPEVVEQFESFVEEERQILRELFVRLQSQEGDASS